METMLREIGVYGLATLLSLLIIYALIQLSLMGSGLIRELNEDTQYQRDEQNHRNSIEKYERMKLQADLMTQSHQRK